MVWLRSLQNPKTLGWQVPTPYKQDPRLCGTGQTHHLGTWRRSPLFTSVPVDPALNIIKDLLDKDHTLKERTVMEVSDIILLLEFCLKNTCFSFQDQIYEQVEGAAMSSPVSPIVANLSMEYLEQKALSTAPTPLGSGAGMWMTPLASTRRSANKVSFNTSIVLTLP